jgi:hypothetical protein
MVQILQLQPSLQLRNLTYLFPLALNNLPAQEILTFHNNCKPEGKLNKTRQRQKKHMVAEKISSSIPAYQVLYHSVGPFPPNMCTCQRVAEW